ncbi:MAG: bifunctional oligoribonuclease/PAP phosphatase NrnA [Lachnospiraceae bacterium]
MKSIMEELKNAGSVAISGHIRPDGDCIGSCMGLYLYLKKVLPKAEIDVYLEKPSDIFQCIKDVEQIKDASVLGEDIKAYDVFVALDCSKDRLGAAQPLFEAAKKTINIDHHISNLGCGKVNHIVPDASSASELIYDLIDKEELDEEIAKALYIGIIHDTGVFQYSNTSPSTLMAAAELIRFGFDFPKLIEETFYEKSYIQNQVLGRALLESILFMNKTCIVSTIDKKVMDFYGVTSSDFDGIVNQLRYTKGVECAIFLYENEFQSYKVSMRSGGKIDVAKVAQYFGGGGHVRAAGCTINGTQHDVINNLSLQIEKQMENK